MSLGEARRSESLPLNCVLKNYLHIGANKRGQTPQEHATSHYKLPVITIPQIPKQRRKHHVS